MNFEIFLAVFIALQLNSIINIFISYIADKNRAKAFDVKRVQAEKDVIARVNEDIDRLIKKTTSGKEVEEPQAEA